MGIDTKNRIARDPFPSSVPEVELFHRARRMFALIDSKLILAVADLPYSHSEWFEREGFCSSSASAQFEEIVRGFVDTSGVYFYSGVAFDADDKSEELFLTILPELSDSLSLPPTLAVYGGMIKQSTPGRWPPKRYLGTVSELLASR